MSHFRLRLSVAMATVLALSIFTLAQNSNPAEAGWGTILGTVTDVSGGTVPGATVVLQDSDSQGRKTVTTDGNGFFRIAQIEPGISYRITFSAQGLQAWTSPGVTLDAGQVKILNAQLRLPPEETRVQVTYDPVEVATEQVKNEEKQRVFGIVPNFYVVYDRDPQPLTAKLKFKLATKVATDPVTFAGVAFMASVNQAADTPNYGQGWESYGKRLGATAANGLTDIMIGGAILPSLLHQDPRYFYQGTGSTTSRLRHAMLSPFIARGDNGKSQPNYSSVGGDLASSAIANSYYPAPDRGTAAILSSFAISTAERVAASVAQEFILGRFTGKGRPVQ